MGGVVSAYGRKKRPAGSSGRHVADDSLREASSILAIDIEKRKRSTCLPVDQKKRIAEAMVAGNTMQYNADVHRQESPDHSSCRSLRSHDGEADDEQRAIRGQHKGQARAQRAASLPPLASLQLEVKPRFLRAMTGNEKKLPDNIPLSANSVKPLQRDSEVMSAGQFFAEHPVDGFVSASNSASPSPRASPSGPTSAPGSGASNGSAIAHAVHTELSRQSTDVSPLGGMVGLQKAVA